MFDTEGFDSFTARDWDRASDGCVRFAMIGLGWWTREHAIPATVAADNCETTVLVSSSVEKGESIAAEYDGIETAITYEDFHEGAAADAYDAIYVCTPNARHLEFVETAADLGKDVLCEKPMEASADRAERTVAAAEAGDITLTIAYRMHTEPAVRRMRRLVRDGFVGDPVQVQAHMIQPLLDIFSSYDQWRLNPDLAGPGASVTDLGIYAVNTSRFVLDADPVAVQSTMWSGHEGFDRVPDERAAFLLEFPEGVAASCAASQNGHYSGQLKVIGTEGELTLEPAFFASDDRTLTLDRGEARSTIEFDPVDQMEEEFAHVADCLLAGTEPEADGEHGLVDMRTIEAIYDARDGHRVEL